MNIAIICNQDDQWEAERIRAEALMLGHQAELYTYDGFSLQLVACVLTITYNDIPWIVPQIGIFRSAHYKDNKVTYDELAYVLRDTIVRQAGYVLNYKAMNIGTFGKLRQQYDLSKNGLSPIDSFYGSSTLPYVPIVAKPLHGSSGDGVRLVTQLQEVIEKKDMILQAVMQQGLDYRVMVVGGIALGVMERRAVEDSFVANISKGASAVAATLSLGVTKLATDVATLYKLEYAGVDLIRDKQDCWHILEVNRFAQFQGFEEATRINVAKALVKYAVSQYSPR